MKKITSSEPITFKVSGSIILTIDSGGVITSDEAAAVVAERLGHNVTIEDAGADTFPEPAAPEPEAPAETEPPAPEPAPLEVVAEAE